MTIKVALFILSIFIVSVIKAQSITDTTTRLNEVEVKAYFSDQPIMRHPSSVSIIGREQLEEQQPYSLLPALNEAPGVHMEERSPGSYRLSIRGSLLRSPFGIRNVKIYMDDFLLTDAGGNSYLNSLDAGGVGRIEIIKGPEASVFGANTGGVMVISTSAGNKDSSQVKAAITGGSYGLFHENASVQQSWNNFSLGVSQAYQRSDGYRENSALQRKYIHAAPAWSWSSKGKFKGLIMYSDMEYRTPGGLTAVQMQQDPRMARPQAGTTPGAVAQKAGVINKTVLGGILHEMNFSPEFRNVTAFTGSHTDFENPFITNYEVRSESSAGIRSYFELKNAPAAGIAWSGQAGIEVQGTQSEISNYGNRGGVRDTVQAADKLIAGQQFFFLHFSAHIYSRVVLEAALSLNKYKYRYGSLNTAASGLATRKFRKELMPRVALSYAFSNNLAWRASVSRGYSSPTIAEVRASDNVINTELQAETGWNYETGVRISLLNNRLYYDGVIFYYHLTDAIVRRMNEDGNEYFINAGGTRQTGIESQIIAWVVPPRKSGVLRGAQLRNSYTYSSFFFSNYHDAENDYSGNRLTGVPRNTVVTSVNLDFPARLSFSGQYNYTSSLPLNDAGTDHASAFHLVRLKISWSQIRHKKAGITVFGGLDNLLNEKYSLGNDLNAFGGRYFNPAPARNFFGGISAGF